MSETSTPIAAPTNRFVAVVNAVLDNLIQGLGVNAAIAAATAAWPPLAGPFLGYIFRQIVEWFAGIFDVKLKAFVDQQIIRVQNEIRKAAYDAAIEDYKKSLEGASDADRAKALQAAKDAMDRLINRNR